MLISPISSLLASLRSLDLLINISRCHLNFIYHRRLRWIIFYSYFWPWSPHRKPFCNVFIFRKTIKMPTNGTFLESFSKLIIELYDFWVRFLICWPCFLAWYLRNIRTETIHENWIPYECWEAVRRSFFTLNLREKTSKPKKVKKSIEIRFEWGRRKSGHLITGLNIIRL